MNVKYNNAYFFVILRSADLFTAALIWRDYDITISSLCGLELRKPNPPRWARWLGRFLNTLQANHCELAIAADKLRLEQARAILGD